MQPKHPLQPIERDAKGVIRFRPNKIVQHLLDHGGIDLNRLAVLGFDREEHEHFAQLIGYSVSGFGSLSYVSEGTARAADDMAERLGTKAPGNPVELDGYRRGFDDGKAAGIALAKQALDDIDQ